ncbi:MAG TPA: hypothetical protein VJN42_00955, partial [Candidatus Acidoferrum sp.]|nr:hypothetical protein [Candidatus Acidoferrum sp.]
WTLTALPAGTGISYLRSQYDLPLKALLAIAGFVLLLACTNIASLLLAGDQRGVAHRRCAARQLRSRSAGHTRGSYARVARRIGFFRLQLALASLAASLREYNEGGCPVRC